MTVIERMKLHRTCGQVVSKPSRHAEDATYCVRCQRHLQADEMVEYVPAEQLRGAVAAERAKFHEYVRKYGRLGYDGPHLDHFLATYSATPGGQ